MYVYVKRRELEITGCPKGHMKLDELLILPKYILTLRGEKKKKCIGTMSNFQWSC